MKLKYCQFFQEENEIPASVFAKEPVPSITEGKEEQPVDENKTLEETLHTVELGSDDDMFHEGDDLDDSAEEKTEESRAEKLKRSSLKKVDSLKKAFSRQNIEKKMNKIVSPERREKIKKSLTVHHQKSSSSKGSGFKVSPLTFSSKKGREGESPAEAEDRRSETASAEQAENEDEASFADTHSDTAPSTSLAEEGKAAVDSLQKEPRAEGRAVLNNIELSIVEDDEEYGVPLEVSSQKLFDERSNPVGGEMEQCDEETTPAAVLQVNQTAWAARAPLRLPGTRFSWARNWFRLHGQEKQLFILFSAVIIYSVVVERGAAKVNDWSCDMLCFRPSHWCWWVQRCCQLVSGTSRKRGCLGFRVRAEERVEASQDPSISVLSSSPSISQHCE